MRQISNAVSERDAKLDRIEEVLERFPGPGV
jgi:hypothetical protein